MTPYQIGVILHHYYSPEPYPQTSPILAETLGGLLGDGLLEYSIAEDRFQITEKGNVFCEALKAVPLPRQAWIVDYPQT